MTILMAAAAAAASAAVAASASAAVQSYEMAGAWSSTPFTASINLNKSLDAMFISTFWTAGRCARCRACVVAVYLVVGRASLCRWRARACDAARQARR